MNRRVLLIDSDTGFHDALAAQLARYGLSVAAEAEPEDALAMAGSDAFDVVMIAVEEPEKLGFKTFQKARKQLPAKLPIVLVTASVTPEAFAKHRGLKTHADAYIDKRGGEAEIFAKLDALLELGDPVADDELPPADDIPMEIGDGDVVLDEEQMDEDPHGGFEHSMATVNPGSGVMVDKMVSAETDAAFDALLGDDMFGGADEAPIEAAVPAPVEVIDDAALSAEESAIPEPVPHKIPESEPDLDAIPVGNEDFDMDSVPAAIDDGGAKSDAFSNAALAVPPPEAVEPIEEDSLEIPSEADGGATVIGQIAQPDDLHPDSSHVVSSDVSNDVIDEAVNEHDDHAAQAALSSRDSLSSIPIVDDDLVSLDDEMPVEVDAEDVGADEAPLAALPVAAAEPRTKSGGHPAVDLGLDDIAENAEREQSGVYDRKSLRKIGELERTVAQLKTELERAKAAGDSSKGAGASRESQFLNLREQNLAKDKELKQLKTTADTYAAELAEAQEKLRQALHAKTALEAKNTQLEDKIFNEGDKEKELTASLTEATARLGNVERELESKAKAAMAAETALAQLERDLASERATRAASASEAEKTLRIEREQLIQRHKGELAAQRAETESAQEHALARLREELDAAHAAAVEEAVEEVRRANAAEHGESLDATTTKHNAELVTLKSEHAGELSRIKNDLSGKVSELEVALSEAKTGQIAAVAAAEQQQAQSVEQLRREHAQALELAQQRFEAEIGVREEELEDARAEDAAAHAKALAELKAQVDAAVAEATAERDRHAQALEKTAADVRAEREGHAQAREQAAAEARALRDADAEAHERAVAQVRTQRDADAAAHASTLAELQAQHERAVAQVRTQRDADAAAHASTLAELQAQLERAAAAAEVKLAAAQREVEAAHAQAETHVVGLVGQHESTVGELRKQHEDELAQAAESARQAAEAHRASLAEQQKKLEAQLAEAGENAHRELSELRGQLQSATRSAQEAAARAQAEREELLQAHASQIGEIEAKQERAMAVANGEALKAKAVADAEHGKEVAALRAEADKKVGQLEADHARVLAELDADRDELRKGLSGARDSLKRSEGELASAVQTIADRNADLRAHAAAIAERDQRITELRAEIESLEQENASYQEQVLRAYQKIKTDEAMVARARKAMAIALTVLDDQGNPPTT